jgi:hypothetical protein
MLFCGTNLLHPKKIYTTKAPEILVLCGNDYIIYRWIVFVLQSISFFLLHCRTSYTFSSHHTAIGNGRNKISALQSLPEKTIFYYFIIVLLIGESVLKTSAIKMSTSFITLKGLPFVIVHFFT